MYTGDVDDTPPTGLRVLLGAVCVAGALVLLFYLAQASLVPAFIVVAGSLFIAEIAVATAPTAAGVTWATVAYGLLLAVVAVTLPL
jgi:hypothetical protein